MAFTPKYPKGATPLTRDELAGLIPNYISTQGELNTLERTNILAAQKWSSKKTTADILSVGFVYTLHAKMFDQVWKWAGSPRTSDKNIGVPWSQITTALPTLLKNAETWISGNVYSWDEIGARFHHRLVEIHVFPNGNGRHARIMTDLLLEKYGQIPFSWGENQGPLPLEEEGATRTEYIEALREADLKKFARLVRFVRS